MLRSFAGIYQPAGPDAAERARLVAALDGLGEVHTMDAGPLAVAWTGPAPPANPADPWCLLDGQLYNLDELARDAGVSVVDGPERVLAAAYRRWGEGMLERLRGDFVVLIWERERNRGLLALDHIGVRCLWLHAAAGRLAFASEVRELLGALPRRPDPDPTTVACWLMGSVPPERTLYQGVGRLPSGHLLRLADGRWDQRRYWEPRYRPRLDLAPAEAADAVRGAIVRAVDRRLRVGEPAGVNLSGGLDSSIVAGVATRCVAAAKRPVGAYSATFPDHPLADETELILSTAQAYGLPSTRIVVHGGSSVAAGLEYLRRWELPPGPATLFWWLPLARRAAADGTQVLLDGEDGDALFGISLQYVADLLRRGRVRAAGRLVHRMGAIEQPKTHEFVLKVLYRAGIRGGLPAGLIRAVRAWRSPTRHVPPYFTVASGRAFHASQDPASFVRGVPRWWGHLVNLLTWGPRTVPLFDHARRRAALAGVESRHPFTDVDLVELVLRLPHELAFDPRFSRPLAREAMREIVPEEPRLRRSKSWFDQVQRGSLIEDLPVIDRLLSHREARIGAYVDVETVRTQLLDRAPGRHERPERSWHTQLWRLAMLECWLRSQEDGAFVDRLRDSVELPPPRHRFAVTSEGSQAQIATGPPASGPGHAG